MSILMRPLTELQLKFVEEYVANGFNGKQAYLAASPEVEETTAANAACKFLKDARIQDAIEAEEGNYKKLSRELGLDKKKIIEKLKAIIEKKQIKICTRGKGDDVEVYEQVTESEPKDVISAINTLLKLTGDFTPEKLEVAEKSEEIDVSKLNEEERETLKAKLVAEL